MKRCKVNCSTCKFICKKYMLYKLCSFKTNESHCDMYRLDMPSYLKENFPRHYLFLQLVGYK